MKRLVLLFVALAVTMTTSAQDNLMQINIEEKFEDGTQLDWSEVHVKNKKMAAYAHNGYFLLRTPNALLPMSSLAHVKAVNPMSDFRVKATLVVPKLDKKNWMGIVYHIGNVENKSPEQLKGFFFQAEKGIACPKVTASKFSPAKRDEESGKMYAMPKIDKRRLVNLRLSAGSKVKVEVEMARKGNEVFFYVNGTEAVVVDAGNVRGYQNTPMNLIVGFMTTSELHVDEVSITQVTNEGGSSM